MERIVEFLGKIVDAQIIEQLQAEELPEDVTIDTLLEAHNANLQDVWTSKLKSKLKEELADELGTAEAKKVDQSWRSWMKKATGLDVNIKSMTTKQAHEAISERIEQMQQGGDEEHKKLVADLKNQAIEAQEAARLAQESIDQIKSEAEAEKAAFVAGMERKRVIDDVLMKIEWGKSGELLERELRNIRRDIESELDVNPSDGSIKTKDGVQVLKPDGNGVYKTLQDWTDAYVDRYNLRKRSNGVPAGEDLGDKITDAAQHASNGKKIDYSKALELARTPEQKALARKLMENVS